MVDANKYLKENFPNKETKIISAVDKNLEGTLDLTGYSNLTSLDIRNNPQLTGLNLSYCPNLTQINISGGNIDHLSFFGQEPTIYTFPKTKTDQEKSLLMNSIINAERQEKLNQQLLEIRKKLEQILPQ